MQGEEQPRVACVLLFMAMVVPVGACPPPTLALQPPHALHLYCSQVNPFWSLVLHRIPGCLLQPMTKPQRLIPSAATPLMSLGQICARRFASGPLQRRGKCTVHCMIWEGVCTPCAATSLADSLLVVAVEYVDVTAGSMLLRVVTMSRPGQLTMLNDQLAWAAQRCTPLRQLPYLVPFKAQQILHHVLHAGLLMPLCAVILVVQGFGSGGSAGHPAWQGSGLTPQGDSHSLLGRGLPPVHGL